jgi:type VI secretion system protein ImpF
MQRFAPYLLDRLFDNEPDVGREAIQQSLTIDGVKDSVARDIEALLNARCALSQEALAGFAHASRSVLRFGLDDFSSRSLASDADRNHICREIGRAIEQQEPRLRHVQVGIDARTGANQQLRFSIRALLQLHPTAEPVNFDAVLQTGTQQYQVSSSNRVNTPT